MRAWALAWALAMGGLASHAGAEASRPAPLSEVRPSIPLAGDKARSSHGYDASNDEPPPSSYDRLGSDGSPALAPESFGMMRQLGRTVLALMFVCALIYLLFKLVVPKLMRSWASSEERTLSVRERLLLDGKNCLMRVEGKSGESYLLAVGEAGVQLLERTAAPNGGPIPASTPPTAPFADALGALQGPSEAKERT